MEDKNCNCGKCEKCINKNACQSKCCNWSGKCPCLKILLPIILMAIIFCLGYCFGKINSDDRYDRREGRYGMMHDNNFKEFKNVASDGATVNVPSSLNLVIPQ